MRFIKFVLLIIIAVGIGFYFIGTITPHGAAPGQQGGAAPVSAAEVIQRDVQEWNEFSGRLVATNHVDIRPQVSGIIEKVHFADGAMVEKDEPLFTIDPRPFEAELTRTQGVLGSAEAQLALTKSQMDRADRLIKDKAIPQQEFDQRKDDYNVAQANVKSARAAVEVARLNLEYTAIKSPIAGRASRAEVTVGNLVETGGSAPILTTVESITPIYADFEIDEASYLKYAQASVTDDKSARKIPIMMALAGETEAKHPGFIESFDNHLDRASGTIRMRASFDNPDGMLVPGLFTRISMGGAKIPHAILITDRAIGTDQNKKFVLVVGADNKVEHRDIKIGGMSDGLRIVTEGLKPGEKIIVSGMQRVMMPGQAVTPEIVKMDAPPETKPAGAPPADDKAKKPDAPADAKPTAAPAPDVKAEKTKKQPAS